MNTIEALKGRRSFYELGKNLPVSEDQIIETVRQITELVPDAFNMHSQKVMVLLGDEHVRFWNTVYDAFAGEVSEEKINSFKAGAGTILFYLDDKIVDTMKKQFALYAEQFRPWALQANGMLQISIWNALCEMGLGASLQHYNPVIDEKVREAFDVEDGLALIAQMVFGERLAEAEPKGPEEIDLRVSVKR